MRFLSTNLHGFLDYIIAAFLIALPWLTNTYHIGGPVVWLPLFFGIALVIYSVLTDYEWGVFPMINLRTHITFDFLIGATLLFSVLYFGFYAYQLWWPHVALSLLLIALALLTRRHPLEDTPHRPASHPPHQTDLS